MIRHLNNSDVNYIMNRMEYFNVSYNMDDIINHPFNKHFIYELDNKQIGFIEYALYYDRIEINYIYVDETFRRKGIGKEILNYLINFYNNQDIKNITLEVSEKNLIAINLYKKVGFDIVSIRKNYYPNGENAILMMRRF